MCVLLGGVHSLGMCARELIIMKKSVSKKIRIDWSGTLVMSMYVYVCVRCVLGIYFHGSTKPNVSIFLEVDT